MRRILLVICGLLTAIALSAQLRVEALLDTNHIKIGAQVDLTVRVSAGPNITDIGIDDRTLRENASVEILSESQSESSGEVSRVYRLTSFDSSLVRIDPIKAYGLFNGDTVRATSSDLGLFVALPTYADSIQLAPIKTIIEEPVRLSDYLPWVLGVVGALLLGFLYWKFGRGKKQEEKQLIVERQKWPHELALEALEALRAKKLWQRGEIKAFQSELTNIFRRYLEDRFEIPALESTTGEILAECSKVLTLSGREDEIRKLLNMADLVKFAKAEPPADIHDRFLNYVEKFVLETKMAFTDSDSVDNGSIQ